MSEGYLKFSNVRSSAGVVKTAQALLIFQSLPLVKSNATKLLGIGHTTHDTIQNRQGGFLGSVV
jgi:hypothetical protein